MSFQSYSIEEELNRVASKITPQKRAGRADNQYTSITLTRWESPTFVGLLYNEEGQGCHNSGVQAQVDKVLVRSVARRDRFLDAGGVKCEWMKPPLDQYSIYTVSSRMYRLRCAKFYFP